MRASEKFMYGLGALIAVSVLTIIALLIFFTVPESNSDELNIAIGAILTAFSGVVGYFFGSSAGSKQKTELLNKKDDNANVG